MTIADIIAHPSLQEGRLCVGNCVICYHLRFFNFDWVFLLFFRARRYENARFHTPRVKTAVFVRVHIFAGAKNHFFGSAHTPKKGVFPVTGMKSGVCGPFLSPVVVVAFKWGYQHQNKFQKSSLTATTRESQ